MTFLVTVGRNGGIYVKRGSMGIRVCLWRVAFDVYFHEFEDLMRIANRAGLDGVRLYQGRA